VKVAERQSRRGPALRPRGPRVAPSDIARLAGRAAPVYHGAALARAVRLFGGNERMLATPLNALPPPLPVQGGAALSRLFGLDRPGHCFTFAPHRWSQFHEPQITGGLVHFLSDGPAARCRPRTLALLRAAFHCAGRSCARLEGRTIAHALAEAELRLDNGARIDILVELGFDDGSCAGAVIEAKFGADLSASQLRHYLRHAEGRAGWCAEDMALLVIAPHPRDLSAKVLAKNRDWAVQSWWTLLDAFERELSPADDCEDFARFRRTIWERAYG